MVQRFLITAFFLMILLVQVFSAAAAGENDSGGAFIGRAGNDDQPILTINPREIDLGAIGPGEESKGILYLKNSGTGNLPWSTEGPDGWTQAEPKKLTGTVGDTPQPLKVRLIFQNGTIQGRPRTCSLILHLEGGGQTAVFRREAPLGSLRETIRFTFPDGSRMAFFHMRLAELASAPLLDVNPLRIDFGTVRSGEQVTRSVHLTNRGRETLKWRAGLSGMKGMPASSLPPLGRYISFKNEAAVGTGSYLPSGPLREALELSGLWREEGGYPSSRGEQDALRYRFSGTGISIFLWKTPEGGPFSVYIDEQFVDFINGFAERKERVEILIADGQPDGPHILTIVNEMEKVILEGVRVFAKPIQRGPRGWISIFPDSGMTTRETDYVNIALNTRQLLPGSYGDRVFFVSNGGEADVEVFIEVVTEPQSRFIDVHRYITGSDYLYTTDPRGEADRLRVKGYRYLGIAFRLFTQSTPGTTEFFRWFNPVKGDHFYSYDPIGGGKPLTGYLFEGSIGNIATSRLTGTRELYRWYNPSKGCHFYTTDQGGEGLGKKGYRFDGIAGFVR